jgi:hypothetical protein
MHDQSTSLPFDDELFWAKVGFNNPLPKHHPEFGTCWLWHGSLNNWGYGEVGRWEDRKVKLYKAHRYAYERASGEPIPDGMWVLHTCDCPACVRCDDVGWYELRGVRHPRRGHLWLGTDKDNSDDKIDKGRAVYVGHSYGDDHWTHRNPGASPVIGKSGEENPAATFTDDDIRAIRRRYAEGDISQLALAKEFGITQTNIGHIVRRATWAHVDDPDAPPAQPRVFASRQGEACGHAKITADDVREMRALHAAGASLGTLAAQFGIGKPNVCLIVNRKTWQNLD